MREHFIALDTLGRQELDFCVRGTTTQLGTTVS